MASKLKVVEPELPRSRVNLVGAIEGRKAWLEKFQAVNAAAERLRGLIVEETNANAALNELERQSAEGAAAWARGETETLRVPENAEVENARKKLESAKRLADAARAAMPKVIEESASAAKALEAHQGFLADAVRQVLLEEVAPTLAARRTEHLNRAAECEGHLIALGEPFKESHAGAPANAGFAQYSKLMRGTLFEKVEEGRATPEMKRRYLDFAGRLARDPAAKLEETSL